MVYKFFFPHLFNDQTEILGEYTYVPEGVELSESGEQQYVYVPVDFNGVDADTGFVSEDGTSVQCFTVGPDGVLVPTQPRANKSNVEAASVTVETIDAENETVEAVEETQEVVVSTEDDFDEPFDEDPKEPKHDEEQGTKEPKSVEDDEKEEQTARDKS
jgi:hypothetical protein